MSLRRFIRCFLPLSLVLAPTAIASIAGCAPESTEDAETDYAALIARDQPAMSKARLDALIQRNGTKKLDLVPGILPKDFVLNVTLKHGKLRTGERGHLIEKDVSQSSDPSAPRAVLWDERSGFTVSYNGGTPGQTAGQRLDVMEFDDAKKEFHLSGLDFNGNTAPVYQTDAQIVDAKQKCGHCHGPSMRPIFGMYPDWPSFYGSDNDELTDRTKEVQRLELADYNVFRSSVAATQSPRYTPLFDAANIRSQLRGVELYPTYPYRQNTSTVTRDISRSFAFRPSLRLGILQNRLMAQVAEKEITSHPSFAKFGPVFLHGLLECRWPDAASLQSSGWIDAIKAENGTAPRTVAGGRALHYRDLLKIFDLEVKDIDIRYSYGHVGYANEDASNKVMEVGYIDNSYWNSYFDGSATIDELLAMRVFKVLGAMPAYANIKSLIGFPDGLEVKYQRLTERFAFDKNFFQEMDRKGTWIPIPYPRAKLDDVHHREGYPERFASQHAALCGALETHIRRAPGASGGNAAACPANCVASTFCKNHPNASSALKVDGLPCMVAGAAGCQACR